MAPPTYHAIHSYKALFVRTENVEMPPANPNDAGVEEQEPVCLVKDLKLLTADVKHLLVDGTKELLKPAQNSSSRVAP